MASQSAIQFQVDETTNRWLSADPFQLRVAWTVLRGWNEVPALLEKYSITYLMGLEMIGAPLANSIPCGSLRVLLEVGLDHQMPFAFQAKEWGLYSAGSE